LREKDGGLKSNEATSPILLGCEERKEKNGLFLNFVVDFELVIEGIF